MKILTIKGHDVLLDDADYDRLHLLPWQFWGNGYVARWGNTKPRRRVWMIYDIMGFPPVGMEIDHVDRNRSNNQRSNLRFCTRLQNTQNRGIHKNNSLGVKGVYFQDGRYRAQIRFNKQKINLGMFGTSAEASMVYQSAAKRLFGQFCSI